jgi:hypothetical protein
MAEVKLLGIEEIEHEVFTRWAPLMFCRCS